MIYLVAAVVVWVIVAGITIAACMNAGRADEEAGYK